MVGGALLRAFYRSVSMLALYIILGFVAVMAIMNLVEFGRVD
jgi:hypothetical protein